MKKLISLILALVMVFGLVACGNAAEDEIKYDADGNPDLTGRTLKIGYIGNMTDSDCEIQQNVIKLFMNKWNTEGTFYGAKVELVAYDNGNNGTQDTEMSIKSAQKLISSDKVQIIIPAQLSNIIQATGALINSAKVLDIGLGLSVTWMQQGWDYVYRSALCNDFQIPSITTAMKDLNQKNISLLYANTDNCLTFRDSLKAGCKTDGINIVCEEMLPSASTSASSGTGTGITGQITKAIQANPDAIFISSMGGEYGTVVKQIRQAGYKGMIYLGQNLWAEEIDSIGDDEINGVVLCTPYVTYVNVEDCKDAFLNNVLKSYKDAYGVCPTSEMVYKAWDAMLLVEKAVLAAKSIKAEDMQTAISTLKFDGCGGVMDFTTGSNECYFTARPWVYTGQGAAGGAVVMEDWLGTELADKIVITNSK